MLPSCSVAGAVLHYARSGCECSHTRSACGSARREAAPPCAVVGLAAGAHDGVAFPRRVRLKPRPHSSTAGGPMAKAIGIDFGTTNSVVAVLEQDGSVTAR